jgi:hypothetical protein
MGRRVSHSGGVCNPGVGPIQLFGSFAGCDGIFYVGEVAEVCLPSGYPVSGTTTRRHTSAKTIDGVRKFIDDFWMWSKKV